MKRISSAGDVLTVKTPALIARQAPAAATLEACCRATGTRPEVEALLVKKADPNVVRTHARTRTRAHTHTHTHTHMQLPRNLICRTSHRYSPTTALLHVQAPHHRTDHEYCTILCCHGDNPLSAALAHVVRYRRICVVSYRVVSYRIVIRSTPRVLRC